MKAPEKVYFSVIENGTHYYTEEIPFEREYIEYIRTDAFIEKALAYLNEKFYFNNLHYAVENNTFHCMEEMFEDFKNYIKGE